MKGKPLDRFHMEVIVSDHSSNWVESSVPETTAAKWFRVNRSETYMGNHMASEKTGWG